MREGVLNDGNGGVERHNVKRLQHNICRESCGVQFPDKLICVRQDPGEFRDEWLEDFINPNGQSTCDPRVAANHRANRERRLMDFDKSIKLWDGGLPKPLLYEEVFVGFQVETVCSRRLRDEGGDEGLNLEDSGRDL